MKKTFIFIGPSGSGKGTQVNRLSMRLESEGKVFRVETGNAFRELIKGEGYSNKLSKAVYESGERQPNFMAVYIWANILIKNIKGDEHLIFDGTPRSLPEAEMLDDGLKFFKREQIYVIFVNTSREWSLERLKERGRQDDNPGEMEKRLDWYEKDVMPAVEYYRDNPNYTFVEINGEQSRDDVEQEIIEKTKE